MLVKFVALKKIFLLFLAFSLFQGAFAQSPYLPLNQDFNRGLQKVLYSKDDRFHTSIRPYYLPEIEKITRYDSISRLLWMYKKTAPDKKWKQKAWDKLFNMDVVTLYTKNFDLVVNPLMNFGVGRDVAGDKTTWVNTRGIEVKGRIGKAVTFYTRFYENQAAFVGYVDYFIRKNHVVPGQGIPRSFKSDGFDYSNVSGYINFQAGKYFHFQLGQGKNFLGDGYRSLILSDVSFTNAYFKMVMNVWHLKYVVLYNQYIDIRSGIPEIGYPRKYSTVHYLSWAISKRVNLSFFDAIVWQATDTLGN